MLTPRSPCSSCVLDPLKSSRANRAAANAPMSRVAISGSSSSGRNGPATTPIVLITPICPSVFSMKYPGRRCSTFSPGIAFSFSSSACSSGDRSTFVFFIRAEAAQRHHVLHARLRNRARQRVRPAVLEARDNRPDPSAVATWRTPPPRPQMLSPAPPHPSRRTRTPLPRAPPAPSTSPRSLPDRSHLLTLRQQILPPLCFRCSRLLLSPRAWTSLFTERMIARYLSLIR